MDEEARRRRAIEMLRKGRRPGDVCAELGRSREWLAKWQRRLDAEGEAGQRDRSRPPKRQARALPARLTRAVLAARERLERRGERARPGSRNGYSPLTISRPAGLDSHGRV